MNKIMVGFIGLLGGLFAQGQSTCYLDPAAKTPQFPSALVTDLANYGNRGPNTAFPPNAFQNLSRSFANVTGGEIVSVIGKYLTVDDTKIVYDPSWPTTINNTQLLVNGTPVPLLYAGRRLDAVPDVATGEIVAQIPDSVTGKVSLQVRQTSANSCVGNSISVSAVQTAGALYHDASGLVIQDSSGNRLNVVSNGGWIVFYGFGFGAVTESVPAGTPFPLHANSLSGASVSFTIDGQQGQVYYAGAAPGTVGLYQFNVHLPLTGGPGQKTANLSVNGQVVETFVLNVQ